MIALSGDCCMHGWLDWWVWLAGLSWIWLAYSSSQFLYFAEGEACWLSANWRLRSPPTSARQRHLLYKSLFNYLVRRKQQHPLLPLQINSPLISVQLFRDRVFWKGWKCVHLYIVILWYCLRKGWDIMLIIGGQLVVMFGEDVVAQITKLTGHTSSHIVIIFTWCAGHLSTCKHLYTYTHTAVDAIKANHNNNYSTLLLAMKYASHLLISNIKVWRNIIWLLQCIYVYHYACRVEVDYGLCCDDCVWGAVLSVGWTGLWLTLLLISQ